MAQNHRLLHANRTKAAIVIVMQVRAANAAAGNRYLHLAGAGIQQGNIPHSKIMRRMNEDGFDGAGHGVSDSKF